MALLLAGCGGGSGGDGASGGRLGGGSNPLQYSGDSGAAVITTASASALAAIAIGDGDVAGATSSSSGGQAEAGQGLLGVGASLGRTVGGKRADGSIRMSFAVDQTDACANGGSLRISGEQNPNGTGTLTVVYENCAQGGDVLTGQATMRIDVFDRSNSIPTDYTLTFTRLAVGGSTNADITGSVRVVTEVASRSETATENIVALYIRTGHMTKSENLVYVDVYDDFFNRTSYTEAVSGRMYHSVHGWVDITTLSPLAFETLAQDFPSRGLVQLTGAQDARMRLSIPSAGTVHFALDLDADGDFERVATLPWADLGGPAGADLGDTDGDGMHNSWELARGLDPLDPLDAGPDSDGDGATNLVEYRAGTDPRDPSSIPRPVGLSIAASDAPDPASVGNNLTYTITVSNTSLQFAADVWVVSTLTAGVNFVSLTATQGTCSGPPSLSCELGTVNGPSNVVVTLVVKPTAEGVVHNKATITTSSFDPIATDNSATSTTTVGLPAAGIQALIDAAAPGSTVTIGPGLYVGGLNFNGKDLVLRSSDGPAATIIHGGKATTAVRMGPGGALVGFTITGAPIMYNSALEVGGRGSLISGNIFDGNHQVAGGFGAAISGNVSSPTIERNVFRNNRCDEQRVSGVVAFLNDSSPRIVNNIFENNACRAVNIHSDTTNTSQVINNTFVGNRSAIIIDRFNKPNETYRNNILVGNGIAFEMEAGLPLDMPVAWTNNLLFDNTVDYQVVANPTGTNGNISADPLFVDQAAGNYHLRDGSPAIGAGSASGAPSIDFDAAARTTPVDIGAFEGL